MLSPIKIFDASGGLMKHLAKDKGGKVVEDYKEKCDDLLNTFNQHLRNKYDRYYYCFVACEVRFWKTWLTLLIAQTVFF